MSDIFVQDPHDRLDYELDYTDWLDGDVVAASTWTVTPTGPTLSSQTFSDEVTVCWIEGMTNNEDYLLTNLMTTGFGRVKERSIKILCRDQ